MLNVYQSQAEMSQMVSMLSGKIKSARSAPIMPVCLVALLDDLEIASTSRRGFTHVKLVRCPYDLYRITRTSVRPSSSLHRSHNRSNNQPNNVTKIFQNSGHTIRLPRHPNTAPRLQHWRGRRDRSPMIYNPPHPQQGSHRARAPESAANGVRRPQ